MTKHEAVVVSAYTGSLLCNFSDVHKYIEKLLRRPIFTHELADPSVQASVRAASKADFIALEVDK